MQPLTFHYFLYSHGAVCDSMCYDVYKRDAGGMGRRAGFRFQCLTAWEFESPASYHIRALYSRVSGHYFSIMHNTHMSMSLLEKIAWCLYVLFSLISISTLYWTMENGRFEWKKSHESLTGILVSVGVIGLALLYYSILQQ